MLYMYKDADVWAKWWKALILIYGKRKTHHPEIADPGHIVSIERERNTHIQRFLIFTFLMSYIPRMIFWSSRHSFVDLESVSLCLSISLSPFLVVISSSILLAITIYRYYFRKFYNLFDEQTNTNKLNYLFNVMEFVFYGWCGVSLISFSDICKYVVT